MKPECADASADLALRWERESTPPALEALTPFIEPLLLVPVYIEGLLEPATALCRGASVEEKVVDVWHLDAFAELEAALGCERVHVLCVLDPPLAVLLLDIQDLLPYPLFLRVELLSIII